MKRLVDMDEAVPVRTAVGFDERFSHPYRLNTEAIEAALTGVPPIVFEVYARGCIDGFLGRARAYTPPAPPEGPPGPRRRRD